MNCTNAFRSFLALIALSLALSAHAQNGYTLVQTPQPTENPAKIEVLEFFYYSCGHCYNLSAPLATWVGKLPADVSFRRMPVSFGRAALGNLAKLYYSLEITGDLAKLDAEVFKAIHEQRINLTNESTLLEWLAKKGVNTQKFSEAFKSFGIDSKIRRGDQLAQAYRIDGVPALIVDGKYLLTPDTPDKLLPLADELIAKARAERAGRKK